MENDGRDVLVVASDEPSGGLLDHHQARRVGGSNHTVCVVHAGPRVQIEVRAVNED